MMKRYDLPQKLLHKGQKLLHKGHFFIAAVFLLTALLGIPAAAESFRMVSVGDGTEGRRTKVGGVYFWGEGHDIEHYPIMVSETKTGEGKVLAETMPWYSVLEILTDGKTVIYPRYDFKAGKVTVTKINTDGTGKETLGKSKIHGCSPNWIVKKYRSKCYYAVGDALYCIDKKKKKNKKLAKGKWLEAAANASSKYIYAVIADSKSVSVKIIDSHTMKVKNTRSTALGKGLKVHQGLATKKYLYLAAYNTKNTIASFYRMQAAGKGGIKKIGTIELTDKKLSLDGSYVINDKYAYYRVQDYSKGKTLYYKYMFSNKKTSVISENVYYKATEKLYWWN